MRRFAWIFVVLGASTLFACLGTDEGSNAESEQEVALSEHDPALRIDPCALVRCRAGTQCRVQAGRPVCVPVTPQPECVSDRECRLFSNYCDGCECLALSTSEPNPVCKGDIVACFVDPCRGGEARCLEGQCVVGGAAASF